MLAHLGAAAEAHGKPNWGYGGPHDAGCYKQWPQETGFFHENGNWRTAYGQFFLQVRTVPCCIPWYGRHASFFNCTRTDMFVWVMGFPPAYVFSQGEVVASCCKG